MEKCFVKSVGTLKVLIVIHAHKVNMILIAFHAGYQDFLLVHCLSSR